MINGSCAGAAAGERPAAIAVATLRVSARLARRIDPKPRILDICTSSS
jgi:hypothetical protein